MKLLENFWVATTKDAGTNWVKDKVPRLAAALAFYSMFSIAPLLLILVRLTGFFYGEATARDELREQLGEMTSPQTAETLMNLAENASQSGDSVWATVVGFGALFFGASGVFGQLQDSLNSIWGIKSKPEKGWLNMIKKRLLSFGMILVIGFLLLISLALSTVISSMTNTLSTQLSVPEVLLPAVNVTISFLAIAVLFGMIFKVLPDANVRTRDVAVGAAIASALFTIGKFFLAWYLGRESTTSAYGAAGAFVLVLLWVYYSSLILFLGAEFTHAYANRKGSPIEPSDHAVLVDTVELEQPA